MTDMIQMNVPRSALPHLQAIFASIGAQMGEEATVTLSKTSKKSAPVADKKPRANAGQPTAHGAYTAKVLAEHGKDSAEFKAFVAKRVADAEAGKMAYTADQGKVKSGKKAVGDLMDVKEAAAGAHIPFAAQWKRDHPEDFAAFKAKFDVDHPKGSRATSVADDASVAESATVSEAPAKKGRKPMTEEAKKAAAAKRAATKAAKSAPVAPVAEPAVVNDKPVEEADVSVADVSVADEEEDDDASVDEEEDDDASVDAIAMGDDQLIDWTSPKGVTYKRIGHLDADGDGVWNNGNWLWAKTAGGEKGAYAGVLLANGKIDASPAILADEPEI